MAESLRKISSPVSKSRMPYDERLAHYEMEKMNLKRNAMTSTAYEAALIALARKWRI